MSKAGLLATRRNRKWKIYDVRTFKNSLAYCLGSHYVGANLFEVVFDLSFRRQGSLLIYDPEYHTLDGIITDTAERPILCRTWIARRPPG